MVFNFNFQSNKQKYTLDSSLDLKLYPATCKMNTDVNMKMQKPISYNGPLL